MTPQPSRRADRARQVADVLRQQIHSGAFDRALPGEAELATEFDVSRNTVRDALALLKDEGLIERAPKVGTHSSPPSSRSWSAPGTRCARCPPSGRSPC